MSKFESVGEILERIPHGRFFSRRSTIRFDKGREPLVPAARWVIGTGLKLGQISEKQERAVVQRLVADPYQMGLPFPMKES